MGIDRDTMEMRNDSSQVFCAGESLYNEWVLF